MNKTTFYDYMKQHKKVDTGHYIFEYNESDEHVTLTSKENNEIICFLEDDDVIFDLYELGCIPNDHIRICELTGKPMEQGYCQGNGDIVFCEEKFEEYMSETYGVGNYRPMTEKEETKYDDVCIMVRDDAESPWYLSHIFFTEWY